MPLEIRLTFCTYFKNLGRFRCAYEIYPDYTAFCLRKGRFFFRIGDGKEELLSPGEIAVCPPGSAFHRSRPESAEFCMIRFALSPASPFPGGRIRITDRPRFDTDLAKLETCLFCTAPEAEPRFFHYCMDILFLAADSLQEQNSRMAAVRAYLEENYSRRIRIDELAAQNGYTTQHFINKFRACCGCTPKQYLSQVRLQKPMLAAFRTSCILSASSESTPA